METQMSAGDRVTMRFAQRRAEKLGHRGDLWLAETVRAGRDAARLLIAYAESLKPPSVGDIEAFVNRHFDGRLRVQQGTQRLHQAEAAVELIASMWAPKREFGDRRNMIQVSPHVYCERNARTGDVQRDAVWDVARDAEGHPFLRRRTAEDIDAIVSERKQRLIKDTRGLSFASVKTAGAMQLTAGDTVRFYADDQTLVGQVLAASGGSNWRIQTATGVFTVPKAAVFECVQAGSTREASDEQKLRDYYSQAFGDPEYADELVRGAAAQGERPFERSAGGAGSRVKFNDRYLDTFFDEKGLPTVTWNLKAQDGTSHTISNEIVLEHIAIAPKREKKAIGDMIRKIDFANGDVNDYLKHLAGAIINQPQYEGWGG